MARMVIVDDDRGMRLLGKMLAEEAGWAVVAEAETGQRGVEQALRHEPDLVIMDFYLPDMDGAEAIRRIRAEHPEQRVFGWTSSEDPATERALRDAGADEVVLKHELDRLKDLLG
jgi:DNA-binding NarL/FixJ family response regulator